MGTAGEAALELLAALSDVMVAVRRGHKQGLALASHQDRGACHPVGATVPAGGHCGPGTHASGAGILHLPGRSAVLHLQDSMGQEPTGTVGHPQHSTFPLTDEVISCAQVVIPHRHQQYLLGQLLPWACIEEFL